MISLVALIICLLFTAFLARIISHSKIATETLSLIESSIEPLNKKTSEERRYKVFYELKRAIPEKRSIKIWTSIAILLCVGIFVTGAIASNNPDYTLVKVIIYCFGVFIVSAKSNMLLNSKASKKEKILISLYESSDATLEEYIPYLKIKRSGTKKLRIESLQKTFVNPIIEMQERKQGEPVSLIVIIPQAS